MAQSSFDIVSEVDGHELSNALDQARKEINTRFDFKGTGTEITHDGESIEVKADSEGRVQAAMDVLKDKLVKRGVSLKALEEGEIVPAAQANFKMSSKIVHGITDEKAKTINKFIKALGVKAQSQIQGEQIRVTSKSLDSLQEIISALKAEDFGIPLQFTNYR